MTTIKREPVSETIARLERYVQRYERRYEISSADMLVHVKDGHCKETAEIGQWLTCYHRLKVLQGGDAQ